MAIAAACSTRSDKPSDSARVVSAVQTQPPPGAPSDVKALPDTCVKNGRWAACSVERRLKQSGFVVTRLDSAAKKREGFSVKPIVYSLGQSRLEVFIYKSEADAARDIAAMDTVRVAPRGKTVTWGVPPLLIRSVNLAAVLLTENARQAERASLALTAGPPQPGSSR